MHKVLVSRCLLGQRVRYDGGAHGPYDLLQQWQTEGRIVPLCPEVAGGLPTPRPPAEIIGGNGHEVLDGLSQVLSIDGEDVTPAFLAGAAEAAELVRRHGIRLALLKSRSPSCGNEETYDGQFAGIRVAGQGVTAATLARLGVQVFNEHQLEQAARWLAALEDGTPTA